MRQRGGQRLEARLAAGQRFSVTHKFKPRVHRVAQYVGQVVQVERGQVLGAVLQAQGAKGPAQRVAAFLVHIDIERGKARPLGQKVAADNAVRQRRVAPLQEGDGGRNGGQITLMLPQKGLHRRAVLPHRQRLYHLQHLAQALGREQAQHQRQRQVFLHGRDAA